jgi:DNA-binding NtrC family response regulator
VARVLIVDDDRAIRRTLEKLITDEGHEPITEADGPAALEAIPGADVVLLDLGLPGMDGLDVIEASRARGGETRPPIIVVTARDDMSSTVRAIQLGAFDYLVKPLDVERLKLVLQRALESRETSRTLHHLVSQASEAYQVGNIIGRSPAVREIWKAIGAVSATRTSVLIRGDSGTGKELVAKAIHYASRDRDRPFVAVNCTAFARELLESELFGHARGAFTGAIADKVGRFQLAGAGTLFLDEIAEIPYELQAKLLRVLQERTFERVGDTRSIALQARVVAATHRDLEQMVKAGDFREDLLYRLKVVEIRLPPLRERREDIEPLVDALLTKINRELHKNVRYVSQRAFTLLEQYDWPGNVRELENALTRAVVLAKTEVLEAELLPITLTEPRAAAGPARAGANGDPGDELMSLREAERRHIERCLLHTRWNKRRACALLEISRPTLDRKINEYRLRRPDLHDGDEPD